MCVYGIQEDKTQKTKNSSRDTERLHQKFEKKWAISFCPICIPSQGIIVKMEKGGLVWGTHEQTWTSLEVFQEELCLGLGAFASLVFKRFRSCRKKKKNPDTRVIANMANTGFKAFLVPWGTNQQVSFERLAPFFIGVLDFLKNVFFLKFYVDVV